MQAEDLSHSKLCLLSPLRGSAAPESRVSVLCLVIRGFQAVILSPVLGPGRAHLQTSGVHITYCNNPRLVCWWWGLRIQHVAAVTWHGLLSCYATLTARHRTRRHNHKMDGARSGAEQTESTGEPARNSNGFSQTMFCQPSLDWAADNRSEAPPRAIHC